MKWFRRVKVPQNADPLVRLIFEQMNEQRIGPVDLGKRAGYCEKAIHNLRSVRPSLDSVRSCLGVLGYELEAVKKPRN